MGPVSGFMGLMGMGLPFTNQRGKALGIQEPAPVLHT